MTRLLRVLVATAVALVSATQASAEEVAGLVNDCLKELALAVYQYEGMVDKFIGDCVMAVFGALFALLFRLPLRAGERAGVR